MFPTETGVEKKSLDIPAYSTDKVYICKNKVAKPHVFIPVFPGNNCEFDCQMAFERAGAEVKQRVFKNLTASDIRESVEPVSDTHLFGIQGFLDEQYIDLSDYRKNDLDIEILKRTPSAFLGTCRYKLPAIHVPARHGFTIFYNISVPL